MPKRDVALLLEDILAAIGKIERYTAGLGREAFLGDDKTTDAVVRNLEIIGEAARAVPDEFAAAHPEVPWARIAGLRNRDDTGHESAGYRVAVARPVSQVTLKSPRRSDQTASSGEVFTTQK